jgi:hypothetical protein
MCLWQVSEEAASVEKEAAKPCKNNCLSEDDVTGSLFAVNFAHSLDPSRSVRPIEMEVWRNRRGQVSPNPHM